MPITKYKTEWDLTKLYKSPDDPQINIDIDKSIKITDEFRNKWINNKDYLSNPNALKLALNEFEKIMGKDNHIKKTAYYANLLNSLEDNNDKYKKLSNMVNQTVVEIQNKLEFFINSLTKLDTDKLIDFSNNPQLIDYQHFLQKLSREAKYVLSEKEEQILNMVSKTSTDNWEKLTQILLNTSESKIINESGQPEKAPFSVIYKNINSTNTKTRTSSAKALYKILKKHSTVAENEINSLLEYDTQIRKLKNIESPMTPRIIADDMDRTTVDALVLAVSKNYDISHKYFELKSKLLGFDKLKYHERNIPLGKADKKFSIDQTIDIISETFAKLDPEFLAIFNLLIKNGQIDFSPKKGKRSGAFCAYGGKYLPVYILMNFDGTLDAINTLAHEMGHAINDELMRKQNELNYGTPLSTAEVASTFMEAFVFKTATSEIKDKEQQLYILMEKLSDEINTIFRQIACFEFEKELHSTFAKKHYLSKQEIGKLFNKHMRRVNGAFVQHDSNSAHAWIHWSHIRSFFYVYSYASGLLISKSLQSKYQVDPTFITKIKTFLSTGLSKSPKDIFMEMGIDISDKEFWELGISQIRTDLDTAYKLAKQLGKI